MKALLLAGLAVVALGGAAQAQRTSTLTSGKLADICNSRDPKLAESCVAYLNGVADSIAFFQSLRPMDGSRGEKLPAYVCIPGPTTGPQLRQAFVGWLQQHTDAARQDAFSVVPLAYKDQFPCSGQPRRAP